MAGIAQKKPKPYFHRGPLIGWDWGVGVMGKITKNIFYIYLPFTFSAYDLMHIFYLGQ